MADGGEDLAGKNQLADNHGMLEALATLPGRDPAVEMANGNIAAIPAEGWIILANVAPQNASDVLLFRYESGSLILADAAMRDTREADRTVSLPFELRGPRQFSFGYASHHALLQYPDESSGGTSMGFVRVPSGRFIVDAGPYSRPEQRARDTMTSLDIRWFVEEVCGGDYDPEAYAPLPACRITDDMGELMAILRQLGVAMGLDAASQDAFATTAEYQLRNMR